MVAGVLRVRKQQRRLVAFFLGRSRLSHGEQAARDALGGPQEGRIVATGERRRRNRRSSSSVVVVVVVVVIFKRKEAATDGEVVIDAPVLPLAQLLLIYKTNTTERRGAKQAFE